MPLSEKQKRPLTERQLEILHLRDRGLSDKEVALKLGLSPNTVREHQSQMRRRLGLPRKMRLLEYARQQHLV